ncbi:MAG: hypothetical protein COB02_01915 [Candidatus Cloacimonadota bacterium]|nr:MAG: hypothetical protein COB02_01915 [Candidatus Cloacimonadota bacterium]
MCYEFLLFLLSTFKFKIKLFSRHLSQKKIISQASYFLQSSFYELLLLPSISILYLRSLHTGIDVAKYAFIISMSNLIVTNISIMTRLEVVINNILIKHKKFDDYYYFILNIWNKVFITTFIPIVMIVAFLSKKAEVLFFHGKYSDIIYLLSPTIFCLFIGHFSYLYASRIYIKNDLKVFVTNSFTSGSIHLISLCILGYFYSFKGAIIAHVIANNIKNFNLIRVYGIIINLKVNFVVFLKVLLISYGVLYYATSVVAINNISNLLTISIASFFSILLVTFFSNVFSKREKEALFRLLNKDSGFKI